jgi:hypothetical protein
MVTITYAPLGPQYGAMQSLHYVRDDAIWLNMIGISWSRDPQVFQQREDERRYGDGGWQRWRMTNVADDYNMQDWMADCNGEGQERVLSDSQDSGVVMMAVVVEEGGGGQWQWRQTTTVEEDNGMQGRAAGYNKEGQEQAAKEGGDSEVVMMAAAAEDGSGGQRWQQQTITAANNKGSRWWRHMRLSGGVQGGMRSAGGKQQLH